MSTLQSWTADLLRFLPTAAALGLVIGVLLAANYLLNKRYRDQPDGAFRSNLIMLGLSFVGLLVVVAVLPVEESSRNQLLSLLGLLLSGVLALSSTTLVGNALAGIMLRAVKSFKGGDFVEIGSSFGRVSERGLFHIEIQTEERNLTTIPNLYMVSHPVTVIRQSGTIVSATVSLGYDIPRGEVERRLNDAARAASLEDPFVHVLELGDFAVTYRLSGLLTDVARLLSARSALRARMLDELHQAGIEIVSPTFMNTRAVPEGRRFIPRARRESRETSEPPLSEIVFDKAEQAAAIERLRDRITAITKSLEALDAREGDARDEEERRALESERERLTRERESISKRVTEEVSRSQEERGS